MLLTHKYFPIIYYITAIIVRFLEHLLYYMHNIKPIKQSRAVQLQKKMYS